MSQNASCVFLLVCHRLVMGEILVSYLCHHRDVLELHIPGVLKRFSWKLDVLETSLNTLLKNLEQALMVMKTKGNEKGRLAMKIQSSMPPLP